MACCLSPLCQSKEYDWVKHKFRYLNKMSLDEKRKLYKCGENFKTIDDVKIWGPDCHFVPEGEKLQQLREIYELPDPQQPQKLGEHGEQGPQESGEQGPQESGEQGPQESEQEQQEPQKSIEQKSQELNISTDTFKADPSLNKKIGIIIGTIDTLEVDAVVVPCNQYFHSSKESAQTLPLPSSNAFNIDIIHKGAGQYLRKECKNIQACPVGKAIITGGYKLPAKFVIHTAAPTKDLPEKIGACYINSLHLAIENDIEIIAFPCISTGGLYGIPPQKAAEKVLRAVREFLELYHAHFELIIFCLKDDTDIITYQDFLPRFFPF